MKQIIDFLKDCLDVFSDAYKYAELDFFKLRNEITSLLDKARSKGYDEPAYCELIIDQRSSYETLVLIQVFYKRNGKFYRFKKELDLGALVNVPLTVKNKLNADSKVTIKLSDFHSLYSVRDTDIKPAVEFDYLQGNAHIGGDMKNVVPLKTLLSIKDELFYYVVELSCYYDNNHEETRVKYFASIKNLPMDIQNGLNNSEEKRVTIEINK